MSPFGGQSPEGVSLSRVADVVADRSTHGEDTGPVDRGRRDRGVVVVDDDGVVRGWDEGAERLFGYTAVEAVGRALIELVIPEWLVGEHLEGFRAYRERGHRTRSTSSWTVPALRADGGTVFVELDVVGVEVDGRHRTVAVIRGATPDRTVSEPLPDLLQVLFARAPEIITLVDRLGVQYAVNDASNRILGYDVAMQWPPDGYSFVHPDDRDPLQDFRRRLNDPAASMEDSLRFRVLDAEGEWRWLEAMTADLFDVPGVEARVLFSRDVTQAEEDRRQLAEARIEAEAQSERLQEFDRARNDFVASVSHELRTPLTSLMSGAELLLDDGGAPLDADTRKTLELVQRNARRLHRLLEDLLFVSRLGTGKVVLMPAPVEVPGLLAEAAAEVAPAAERRGVRVVVDARPGPPLHGDAGQLHAVAVNLLSNAVKYTDEGTSVEVCAVADEKGWTIDVTDHGPGVAPGEEQRIFERFARGSAATEAGSSGSGLGLAITRGIVQLHGGSVEVAPHQDRGARFRCRLPLQPPAEGAEGPQ